MIDFGGMDFSKDLTEYGSVAFDKSSLNCSMRSPVKHLTEDSVDKLVEVYIATSRLEDPQISKGTLSEVGLGRVVLKKHSSINPENELTQLLLLTGTEWAVMKIVEQSTGELLYDNPNIQAPYVQPVIPEVLLLDMLLTSTNNLATYSGTPDIFNS